jgi:hypothetical protein
MIKKRRMIAMMLLNMISVSKTKAQMVWEPYSICPIGYTNNSSYGGGGVGISAYSKPIVLIGNSKNNKVGNGFYYGPLNMQFGGNAYVSFMGEKNFTASLIAPETGTATVSFDNYLYGMNPSIRFTSSMLKGKVMPYVEGFGGFRSSYSGMSITPQDASQSGSDSTIHRVNAVNVGVAGGVIIKIAQGVRVNVGAAWSHSEVMGSMVDLNSIEQKNDVINVTSVDSPYDYLFLKAGFTFDIDNRNTTYYSGGSSTVSTGHCYHGHVSSLGHCGGHVASGLGHVKIKFH